MSNQQPLSGMEIRELAERIVKTKQGSDVGLEAIIETILREYIMLPKYAISSQPGPVTMTFGPTPIPTPNQD